jgi:nucleoid-associated protein YgaU
MRTEVKIVILVCLVLAGLVATYFALWPKAPEQSSPTAAAPATPRPSTRPGRVSSAPPPSPVSAAPAPSGAVVPGLLHLANESPTTRPFAAAQPVDAPASPAAAPVSPSATPAPVAAVPVPVSATPVAVAAAPRTGSPVPGVLSATPAAAPAPKGPYTVAAGDKGFYDIAKKVYGDSKYYYLIAKANPAVQSERLTPGMKLVIPPLPVEAAAVTRTPSGAAAATPGGDGAYVVKENETFWSIAEKQYGNGASFVRIAEANPTVNPNKLRAGQKLVIPKLTTVGSAATTRPAAPRTAAGGSPSGAAARTSVAATAGAAAAPDSGYVPGKPYFGN